MEVVADETFEAGARAPRPVCQSAAPTPFGFSMVARGAKPVPIRIQPSSNREHWDSLVAKPLTVAAQAAADEKLLLY